jgi:hypothetical protein
MTMAYFGFFRVLYKNRDRIKKMFFKKKFKALIEDMNIKTTIGVYWNLIILGRWLLTNALLVFLRDYYL